MHIQQNHPLAPHTTLRIGGAARYFARITTPSELLEALAFARAESLPIFVLGGGSNLVISDAGFPGLVLHLTLTPTIRRTDDADSIFLDVSAGYDWDSLVLYTCEQGISGMECLAGIPGLVGASPIQNIGAYGQEVAQTIHQVTALDLETGEFVTLNHADCRFSYRRSIFNSTHRERYILTSVRFRFSRHAVPRLAYADLQKHFVSNPNPASIEIYFAVRQIRAGKGMLIDPAHLDPDTRSAGSFFKNPVVPAAMLGQIAQALTNPAETVPHWPTPSGEVKLPAAWLIEHAGFPKGFAPSPQSTVGISTRHTLALTNRTGTATCADLLALRDHIIHGVRTRFTVTLEQEPVFLK